MNLRGLNSISGRLTAIALCFIVGTSVAVGVAGFQLTARFEEQRYQDHFTLMASYLARNAELGVLLGNIPILERLVNNLLAVGDVQAVSIVDPAGEIIISRAASTPPPELGRVVVPVLTDPMDSAEPPFLSASPEREVLGEVRLFYSYSGLRRLKELLARRFVLVSLLLGTLPVLMYWLLARAINAPLRDLLTVAGEVGRGNLAVRARGGTLRDTVTLAGAFNEMLDALAAQRRQLEETQAAMARQQALAEVGRFSMIVAHEIKNPLAIIKGSLEVVNKEPPPEPEVRRRMMGFLDEEIARINKLVEDFLLYARPRDPAFRRLPAGEVVAALGRRITMLGANFSGLPATTPDPPAPAWLDCDLGLLERAVLNIVSNALEAEAGRSREGPKGGADQGRRPATVAVGARLDDRWLLIAVEDRGSGVAPENLPRIFEPFFSAKAKGTGLGLAIAREIIENHGGVVAAANRSGGGARFTVRLPLAPGAAAPDHKQQIDRQEDGTDSDR